MVKKAIDLTKAVDLQRENKSPLRTFTTRVHYCLISWTQPKKEVRLSLVFTFPA